MTTSATVSISSNCTSLTEARIVLVRSVRICRLDGRRQRAFELRQEIFYPIHDRDDIGARLPLNIDDHCRHLIHPCRLFDVFHVVDDRGDIGKMDRCAVAIGDDQRPVLVAR